MSKVVVSGSPLTTAFQWMKRAAGQSQGSEEWMEEVAAGNKEPPSSNTRVTRKH